MTDYGPPSLVTTGYSWTECPRWHDGEFYFSDIHSGRVIRVDADGVPHVRLDLTGRGRPEQPTPEGATTAVGTGFLPDGRLLVNLMFQRQTLVDDGTAVRVFADLSDIAVGPINDMVVDAAGRVYVSQLGYNIWNGEAARTSPLIVIEPDGTPRALTEAGDFAGANGLAISADGRTMVVAETFARRLIGLELGPDGTIGRRWVFAELDRGPDGICLDEQGGVWVAQPGGTALIRVLDGGAVTDRVPLDIAVTGRPTACVLGGPDRDILYVACGFESRDFIASARDGQGAIWSLRVPVGAGGARP